MAPSYLYDAPSLYGPLSFRCFLFPQQPSVSSTALCFLNSSLFPQQPCPLYCPLFFYSPYPLHGPLFLLWPFILSMVLCFLFGPLSLYGPSSLRPSVSSTAICPPLITYVPSLALCSPPRYSVPSVTLCPLYGPLQPLRLSIPSMAPLFLLRPSILPVRSVSSIAPCPRQPLSPLWSTVPFKALCPLFGLDLFYSPLFPL